MMTDKYICLGFNIYKMISKMYPQNFDIVKPANNLNHET